ncbi:unnamed protein product, partial [Porites evermanni]
TVTLNTARPILPQQQQQRRKISAATGSSPTVIAALTSTVNRTTTNLQPLVPIGIQLQQPRSKFEWFSSHNKVAPPRFNRPLYNHQEVLLHRFRFTLNRLKSFKAYNRFKGNP